MTTDTAKIAFDENSEKAVKKYGAEVARMSDDDVRAFILAACDGKLYTSVMCDPNMLTMVFMPLLFMLEDEVPKTYLESIGLIYEELSKAGPRAINGCPSFFSMRLMHRLDADRVQPLVLAELERRKNLEV